MLVVGQLLNRLDGLVERGHDLGHLFLGLSLKTTIIVNESTEPSSTHSDLFALLLLDFDAGFVKLYTA